jgi:heme exporter protein B
MLAKEIWRLVRKEVLIELRMQYALSGMLLYLISSMFLGYITFELGMVPMSKPTWNVLFWVIMLFVATNSITKSFIQESKDRQLYYYTIASPQSIILSKIIFNSLLMMLLMITGFVVLYCFAWKSCR